MFFIEYPDGSRKREYEIGDWDRVPADQPLKAIGLAIPTMAGHVMPVILAGYERYYCARTGEIIMGDMGTWAGYTMIAVKDGIASVISAHVKWGISVQSMPAEQLAKVGIRETAWRPGVKE